MKDDFVNLHLHTLYSKQDSVIKIPDLFYFLQQQEQKAVAITDHGSLAGWNEFYLTSKDFPTVKPIFGCEFYCKDTYNKPQRSHWYHLVVLAKNDNGIKTINKLHYEAEKHSYYKPLLPYPFLFENHDDIFVSTACVLGTLGQCFDREKTQKKPEDAPIFLNNLVDAIGKENVALEFQFHPKLPLQRIVNSRLLDLWNEVDMKYCIATTDAHFITDPKARRILQADAFNKTYKESKSSLKSNCVGTSDLVRHFAEESGFPSLKMVDKMIANTSVIADQCNVTTVNNIGGERRIPRFNKHKKLKKLFCKQPKKVV